MRNLLNPNVETVILGGLGSDRKCVETAAKSLEAKTNTRVIGVTNHEARVDPCAFASFLNGRNVIPYSGGATIAFSSVRKYDAAPASVSFVAPPDVLSRFGALRGFAKSARARNQTDNALDYSVLQQVGRFVREVGSHPEDYYRLIHEARRFEQLAAAVALQASGIEKVALVVPKGDEMFSSYELPLDHNEENDVDGVRYIVVDGNHTRFSSQAGMMLDEAQHAPFAVVTERVLGVDIPERLWAAPTLGEALTMSAHSLVSHIAHQRQKTLRAV